MRKSYSGTGRPSLSAAPLRVKQEDGGPSHSQTRRGSSLDRASLGSKLPISRKSVASSSQQNRPRHSSFGKGNATDHRRASSLSQNSFIPKSGRPSSGIGVRGRTDVPKDSRPISDKQYQRYCISNLLEFLTNNHYTQPISQKLLVSPSNKDFFSIFEFIMGHFWEDYKLESKMQEEVPRILKLLGYPYNLPKTYLCSVGSPHTWPHLLAALTWMLELFQMKCSTGGVIDGLIFAPTDENFDDIPDDQIFFNYKERTFCAFMSGADTFEEEDQALEKILLEKYHGGNVKDIAEENKRMEAMIEDRRKVEAKINGLKDQQNEQNVSQKQRVEYLHQLQQHRQSLLNEVHRKEEELAIIKSDLQMEESRLVQMQTVYENQDLKPADVERLKAEQDRLQAQVHQLEKQTADISADHWQVNMEQAKLNEKLEAEVDQYNRHAITLKLVPETAEFAQGKDFRLRAGFSSDVVMDFQNTVKPKLTLMKKNLNEQVRCNKKEHFRIRCDIEKMQEMLSEKKEKLSLKERELEQMEAEIEMLKQASSSEQRSELEELGALEHEVAQLEAKLTQVKTEKARAVEESVATQKSLHSTALEAKEAIAAMAKTKEEMRHRVAEHTQNIKRQLLAILEHAEAVEAEETRQLARVQQASERTRSQFGLPVRATAQATEA